MKRTSGLGSYARYLAAVAVAIVLAAATSQAAGAFPFIGVVGSLQVAPDEPYARSLTGVAAFEAPGGRPHLLAVGNAGIYTIDVTYPANPVQVGEITGFWPDRWWPEDIAVLYPAGGRVYAAIAGHGALMLDVTDPANPEIVDGSPDDPGHPSSALGDALDIRVLERPDGRVHALVVAGGNGALQTVNVTDPLHPAALGDGATLGLVAPLWDLDGAVFQGPGDGRTYAAYVGSAAGGVLIVDVTDPLAPAPLLSSVRYGDDRSPLRDRHLGTPGIPAAASSDIRITGGYAAGLRHPGNVAVFESPDGRAYAMVSNHGFTTTVGGSDPRSTPAGILFLDVTDPRDPLPVGAIRDGEGGFDFGSHIREIVILDSPGGRVHAVVAGGQDAVILDVTDPADPVPVSRIRDGEGGFDGIGLVFGMAVVEPPGGRTYLALAGSAGIQMADVTDPGDPAAAGSIPGDPVRFGDPKVFEPGDGRTYALGAGGDGVHVADITDRSTFAPLGSIRDGEGGFDTLDGARQVEVLQTPDGRTYGMAVGGDGLQVIEVTDPAAPAAAGSLPAGEGGLEVGQIIRTAVLQQPGGSDYLLVADHGRGIHVVEVTDPHNPILAGGLWGGRGGIDLLGGIHDLDVFETADGRPHVLMAGDRGIHTIDIRDPASPFVAGTLDGAAGKPALATVDQAVIFGSAGGRILALVADYTTGLHIIDLTQPYLPAHTASIPIGAEGGLEIIPGSAITTVASPDGRTWALVPGLDNLQIVNVTDPYNPALAASVPTGEGGLGLELAPWEITAPWPAGDRIHTLAGGGHHLWVLDVTYPMFPVPEDGAPAHDGDRVLALDRTGDAIWVGGPEIIIEFEQDGLAGGGDALWIVDLTDPYAPLTVGMVPSPFGRPGDIKAAGSPDGRPYGVMAGPAGGLLVADLAHPDWTAAPAAAGDLGLAPDPPIETFRPHDGRAYLAAGTGNGIRIIDITYPADPVPVSHILDNLGGFYYLGNVSDISVFESGDGLVYALVGSGDGVQVVDITNPYHPSPAGGVGVAAGDASPDHVHRIAALGTSGGSVLALAVGGSGHTTILDITDPADPVPAGTIPPGSGEGYRVGVHLGRDPVPAGGGPGHIPDVAAFEAPGGGIWAMLAGYDGLRILNITDPADPIPVVTLKDIAGTHIISVFEPPGGRPHVLLAGEGTIWAVDIGDPGWFHGMFPP